MVRRMLPTLALAVLVGGVLSGCGNDSPEPATPKGPGTPSEAVTTAVAPSELAFGDAESVSWQPTRNLSGELSVRVDGVREGRAADFTGLGASGITEENQPYYVDVAITNEGDAELGGLDVPLYLTDSQETLTPPSRFGEPFEPCASGPLPDPFGAGEEAQLCLVFFASPGAEFESITFQPGDDAAAVAWTGDVAVPAEEPTKEPVKKPGSKKRR